jgi:ribosomal protein S18 acetylase RimI-like enzyme
MQSSEPVRVHPFQPEQRSAIANVLMRIGWEQRYIEGQLAAIEGLAADREDGRVLVAHHGVAFAGYVSVQFHTWNRLAQLHGLAVDPAVRRRGVAARLVQQAEVFVRERRGRGVYVDTPVNNLGARAFYTNQQYYQDYIMTAYYDTDLDGVTYLKLF